jgi:hypothetical protein
MQLRNNEQTAAARRNGALEFAGVDFESIREAVRKLFDIRSDRRSVL